MRAGRGPSRCGERGLRVRGHMLAGALLWLSVLSATTGALADSPPMPPCPPGWEQVDKFTCKEPFACPPGWKLDSGPVCVPWECEKNADCSWKGSIPCREANVCVGAAGGRALRVCEGTGGSLSCPSGLSCQKRKLCANFSAAHAGESFGNWTPGSGSAASSVTKPPVSSSAAAATPATGSEAAPPARESAPGRRSGCAYVGTASPVGAGAPLGLLTGLLPLLWLARRRLGAGSARPRG